MSHHEVTIPMPWSEVRSKLLAMGSGINEHGLVAHFTDWCNANTPSYDGHSCRIHDVCEIIMNVSFNFFTPNPPAYNVTFRFQRVTDAIFFKLRWLG